LTGREGRQVMTRVAAAAIVMFAVLAWRGALPDAAPAHRDGRSLRGSVSAFPDYLDPQLASYQDGWMAMYNTYIPLLTYRHAAGKAGSKIIPGLAKGLPRLSDRGKTYTLYLRRGLKYSNGRQVKASDFKATIVRLFKLRSEGAPYYSEIVGAERFWSKRRGGIAGITANDRTGKIVIRLIEPRNEFTSLLALPFAAPVPSGTEARDLTSHPPPATGPYTIARSSRGRSWSYARNPAWSKNGRLMPQLPSGHVNRISVRVIHKPSDRIRAVEDGNVDWTSGWLANGQYAELKGRYDRSRLRDEPTLSTEFFWMNTRRAPFNDPRVRAAVNFAVDRSVLRKIYGDELLPTYQILPPGMPGYKKLVLYPHSMIGARRLIAEAHPSDRKVTIWSDGESEERRACAYYRDVLRELGFTVHLKVVKTARYYAAIGKTSTPDLDTGLGNWLADYPHPNDFFEPLLASWSIFPTFNENLAQIDNWTLDSTIIALGEKRGAIPERAYAALDRAYTALAPWIPYGTPTIPLFVSKSVPFRQVIWSPSFGADLTSFRFK
jgi:peptide/nickel transport system substrate-binding protein